MASELRVNTLKDASGNNSVGMSFVAEGTAKAWLNLNGSGTIAVRDSFNVSGVTDVSTGIYTTAFSSSFGNANYSHSHTNITNVNFIGGTVDNDYVQATGSIKQRNADWTGTASDNASTNDSLYFHIQEFGDLA